MKKWMPLTIAALFAAWFLSGFRPAEPKDGFDLAGFGRLPVLLDGRIQPLDSVARNSLLSDSISGVVVSSGDQSLPSPPRRTPST